MAEFQKKLLKKTLEKHISDDQKVKELLEWGRDQIKAAVKTKQHYVEELEHSKETSSASSVTLDILKAEQKLNDQFIANLSSAIDQLERNIRNKMYDLENPQEEEYDDDSDSDF
jgi:hypothetical protein